MAADQDTQKGNTGAGTTSSTGGTTSGGSAAGKATSAPVGGQQISGEQIFSTTESSGGESFATTEAGGTGGDNQANLADAVSDAVSGDTGKAKDLLNQAKSATGQVASQTLGQVQQKASTLVDTKTSDLAQSLTGVVDTLRQANESLRDAGEQTPIAQHAARYGDTLITQVEQLAGYLDRADLNQLTRDVEKFARRNPAVFLGTAFAAGVLLSRFLKSGTASTTGSNTEALTTTTGGASTGGNLSGLSTGTGTTTPDTGSTAL